MRRQFQPAPRGGGWGGSGGFSLPPSASVGSGEAMLKRRRSPARAAAEDAPAPSIAMRARSKSKSRARAMAARPGMEFIPLGSSRGSSRPGSLRRPSAPRLAPAARPISRQEATRPAPRVGSRDDRGREPPRRAPSASRRASRPGEQSFAAAASRRASPVSSRTRSKSVDRPRTSAARRRSPSSSESSPPRSRSRHSHSHSRRDARASSARTSVKRRERSPTPTATTMRRESQEIDARVADAQHAVDRRKRELRALQDEQDALRKRVEEKRYEVADLELELEGLRKRQALARRFRDGDHDRGRDRSRSSRRARSASSSSRRSRPRSTSRSRRPSKRPCIVDEDDEDGSGDGDGDDDVVIIGVKQERAERRPRDPAAHREPTAVPAESPPRARAAEMPDHFWGRAREPKLLARHRFKAIPDGSARKGRHLCVNPMKPSILATSADEGGLILWSYDQAAKEVSKVVTLTPASFRRENACAESVQWSPDGNRIAMAFRDPLDGSGEFCVAQLHQLKLRDSSIPQAIPRNRLASKATTLHPKGISAIAWLPSGEGSQVTSSSLVTTGGSDHAVVLWTETEDAATGKPDFAWRVLHREHRSDIKALCIHSDRSAVYTGGLDGLVVHFDLHRLHSAVVMERRKPSISRINAVLEHPHNPHLLLISSLEQNEHNLLLRDLRDRAQRGSAQAAVNMTWAGGSTSQYIVPRWSPAGMHVSCGTKTGVVNIWDVRMRSEQFPNVLPQQSLHLHQKTVLHATWHPLYDAIFTVSFDRTIGLSTFR